MDAIQPERLKILRERKKLTQEKLANKVHLTKQTLYRYESGRGTQRTKNIEAIAEALDVHPDVLRGLKPLPEENPSTDQSGGYGYPVSARVDSQQRNAFTLVSLRYGVSISQIVALAPLLFALEAERSIQRRRTLLEEARSQLDNYQNTALEFRHLPGSLYPWGAEEVFEAEEESIRAEDIFAETLPDKIFELFDRPLGGNRYEDNPFCVHLKGMARSMKSIVKIDEVDRDSASYQICCERALNLAGGDKEVAKGILNGEVLLYRMPRELLKGDAAERRTEWLRAEIEKTRKAWGEIDLDALLADVEDLPARPQEEPEL